MAEGEGGSSTGTVAIVAIFVIVLVLALLAWQGGLFGGSRGAKIDVNINTPGSK